MFNNKISAAVIITVMLNGAQLLRYGFSWLPFLAFATGCIAIALYLFYGR